MPAVNFSFEGFLRNDTTDFFRVRTGAAVAAFGAGCVGALLEFDSEMASKFD